MQELKQLSRADLSGGSPTIGFVQYGLPYTEEPAREFCVLANLNCIQIFSKVSGLFQQIRILSNKLYVIEPRRQFVLHRSLAHPHSISCTISGTCGEAMQRFQKGETIIATVVVKDKDGELLNPSEGVAIEIRKEDGTKVLETNAEKISSGVYSADIQTKDGFSSGEYIIVFKATDGSRISIDWDRFRIEEVPGI